MTSITENNLPLDKFYHFEKVQNDRLFMKQPLDGVWKEYTWGEFAKEVRILANAIKGMDLPPQSKIGLLSKNCAHWIISDFAIWLSGHTSVPIYPTLTGQSIDYILEHSEAKLLIVGKLDDWAPQHKEIKSDVKKVAFPFWNNEGCTSYEEFTRGVAPLEGNPKRAGDELATIIYTSGTTGKPKGVMHSFESLAFPIVDAMPLLSMDNNDQFFSYLPLSHVAERLIVEMGVIYTGGYLNFAESLDKFAHNLAETRPTVFLAVPRIWTKFQLGILGKLPQKKLDIIMKIPFVNKFFKKMLAGKLGLDRARLALTGAAAISKDTLGWFQKNLGITIYEAYGMSENFCYCTFNLPSEYQFGTVGKAWPYADVKISDIGEIIMKSDANMLGYYKEEGLTKEAFDDQGYLRTGDKGQIDEQGYLRITGRVKDLFKTSKGKYVSPAPIENLFAKCELVEQVCVMGQGLPQPIALVNLSDNASSLSESEVSTELSNLLTDINTKVEGYEKLAKLVIIKGLWTIESGDLTPTMKIKRNVVEDKYSGQFEDWYGEKSNILSH